MIGNKNLGMFNPLSLLGGISGYWPIIKSAFFGVSIIGLFLAGYFSGLHQANDKIHAYINQLNTEITSLQNKNSQTNDQVVTQYVDKWHTIVQKEVVYVKQAQDNVPSQYFLSNGWVYNHDAAASLTEADPARSSDATPSTIKDNVALATIDDNYSACHQIAAQLTSLQQWILDYNINIDQVNAKK